MVSYSFRYILIKVFVLIAPFAILSNSLNSTSWFFKSWIKNLFSLLFIQIIVSIILLILFSMNFSSGNLAIKFIYVGGLFALIKANSVEFPQLFHKMCITFQKLSKEVNL